MRHASILYVDDDPTMRSSVSRWLRLTGQEDGISFKVTTAESVSEAKELLSKETFTFIMSDIMMKGGNGTDLHRWVMQTHPEYEGRFILCSGFLIEALGTYVKASGAPFLEKPLHSEEVRGFWREALESFEGKPTFISSLGNLTPPEPD